MKDSLLFIHLMGQILNRISTRRQTIQNINAIVPQFSVHLIRINFLINIRLRSSQERLSLYRESQPIRPAGV